jgi:hypothetical protein
VLHCSLSHYSVTVKCKPQLMLITLPFFHHFPVISLELGIDLETEKLFFLQGLVVIVNDQSGLRLLPSCHLLL